MTLPGRASIGGRILDEYGDPMENANVRVERTAIFKAAPSSCVLPRRRYPTDRRSGRYRISGLPPGRYLVSAVVGDRSWPRDRRLARLRAHLFSRDARPGGSAGRRRRWRSACATIRFRTLSGQVAACGSRGPASARRSRPVSLTQSYVRARSPRRRHRLAPMTLRQLRVPRVVHRANTSCRQPRARRVSTEGEFAVAVHHRLHGDDATGHHGAVSRRAPPSKVGCNFEGGDPPEDLGLPALAAAGRSRSRRRWLDISQARADIHDDGTFEITGINGPRRLELTHAPGRLDAEQVAGQASMSPTRRSCSARAINRCATSRSSSPRRSPRSRCR